MLLTFWLIFFSLALDTLTSYFREIKEPLCKNSLDHSSNFPQELYLAFQHFSLFFLLPVSVKEIFLLLLKQIPPVALVHILFDSIRDFTTHFFTFSYDLQNLLFFIPFVYSLHSEEKTLNNYNFLFLSQSKVLFSPNSVGSLTLLFYLS